MVWIFTCSNLVETYILAHHPSQAACACDSPLLLYNPLASARSFNAPRRPSPCLAFTELAESQRESSRERRFRIFSLSLQLPIYTLTFI